MKASQLKQKCDEAVCAVENAMERLRRASRKNEKAAVSHLREKRRPQDDEPTLDMSDSGLHAI